MSLGPGEIERGSRRGKRPFMLLPPLIVRRICPNPLSLRRGKKMGAGTLQDVPLGAGRAEGARMFLPAWGHREREDAALSGEWHMARGPAGWAGNGRDLVNRGGVIGARPTGSSRAREEPR